MPICGPGFRLGSLQLPDVPPVPNPDYRILRSPGEQGPTENRDIVGRSTERPRTSVPM